MNNAAVALALYNRYLKLPSVWELRDPMREFHNETNTLLCDGPLWVCSEDMRQHQGLDTSKHVTAVSESKIRCHFSPLEGVCRTSIIHYLDVSFLSSQFATPHVKL